MADVHKVRRAGMASLAVILLWTLVSGAGMRAPAETGNGATWSILFAGHPGSEREKDFVGFLREHFGKVETADLKTFEESQCNGFDVTILDYDGDLFKAPRPRFSPGFSRPVLTVAVPGAFICSQARLKTGYL